MTDQSYEEREDERAARDKAEAEVRDEDESRYGRSEVSGERERKPERE